MGSGERSGQSYQGRKECLWLTLTHSRRHERTLLRVDEHDDLFIARNQLARYMATKRNPEERSVHAAQAPGASAKPSGNEVFDDAVGGGAAAAQETNGAGTPEEVEHQLRTLAAEYYENLSQSAEELSRHAAELVDSGMEYVRRNPLATIGVAAGIGLLIGLLIDQD